MKLNLLILAAAFAAPVAHAADALIVIAHGANKGEWNQRVVDLVEKVEWNGPKAAAFLTPRTEAEGLPAVAARLDKSGAARIVVVPLFISSFSNHFEEIRYYTGDRKTAPDHYEHAPIRTRARMVMTAAMDSDRLIGRILAEQVRPIVKDAAKESLFLVGHGPNDETDNERWLECLRVQAGYLASVYRFKRVDVATIRDDAPEPVRSAAIAALNQRVKRYGGDSRVVVLPVAVSTGMLQAEIREAIDDDTVVHAPGGVATHPLARAWILQQASTAVRLDLASR
jgi:sirohydrochlorin ferrochelatase